MRLLEHYTSTQGEGPRTGTLTQFVRFAGCNLRCPGWPCDTPQAIFPDQYNGKYEGVGAPILIDYILKMREDTGATNICITGGEPFIQSRTEMNDLLYGLVKHEFDIEVFTNGTRDIPPQWIAVTQINMDWKLDGSGEGQVGLDERMKNARLLKPTDMIKFVVKDHEDLQQAVHVTAMLADIFLGEFWVGAAFGHIKPDELVEYIVQNKLPWKLNIQAHKYIWEPTRTHV